MSTFESAHHELIWSNCYTYVQTNRQNKAYIVIFSSMVYYHFFNPLATSFIV